MKNRWVQLFVLPLALINGCSSVKPDIGKEQAIALAKQEVMRRGWKEVDVESADLDRGHWQVMLWRSPKTPGGHATVELSRQGKLIRFVAGK